MQPLLTVGQKEGLIGTHYKFETKHIQLLYWIGDLFLGRAFGSGLRLRLQVRAIDGIPGF